MRFLQNFKFKTEQSDDPIIPLAYIYAKPSNSESPRDICTPMDSIIHDSQVIETIQMSVKYTTEYYSSFKKKEILFVTTCMNLEGIRLHEVSQSQKASTA